ncbi:MAG: 16S rRNA processing protein RimM [Chloroflexi bacterium]|nr:16S rRNA processing protein RimM [Chloroflexota bacterium]
MSDGPPSDAVSHVVIGRVAGPRGVAGELKIEIVTDFPERFAQLKRVFLGESLTPFEVEMSSLFKRMALLKLRGVETVEQAAKLTGQLVLVPVEEAVPLAEGQYYWHEIIGLEVWTTDGQFLGHVTDILRTGANDVYVVHNGKEILVPAIEQVIKEIKPDEGKMIIEPMPGMLES